MRVSTFLYAIGAGFLAAGIVAEVQEFKKRQETWQNATSLDGKDSSSSQRSPQSQPSSTTE